LHLSCDASDRKTRSRNKTKKKAWSDEEGEEGGGGGGGGEGRREVRGKEGLKEYGV
jgi:hypothetical protein